MKRAQAQQATMGGRRPPSVTSCNLVFCHCKILSSNVGIFRLVQYVFQFLFQSENFVPEGTKFAWAKLLGQFCSSSSLPTRGSQPCRCCFSTICIASKLGSLAKTEDLLVWSMMPVLPGMLLILDLASSTRERGPQCLFSPLLYFVVR